MANMSYCRFQNTLGDLRDCKEALFNLDDPDNGKLSEDERNAAIRLVRMCKQITEEVDENDLQQ